MIFVIEASVYYLYLDFKQYIRKMGVVLLEMADNVPN